MDMTAFRLNPELLDTPAVFPRRRFTDPVSDLNAHVYDKSRLLAQAVAMVDGLGIKIISVEAGVNYNNSILVAYSHECNALEGVEVKRHNGNSHWCANRFGTEIRWCIPMEVA